MLRRSVSIASLALVATLLVFWSTRNRHTVYADSAIDTVLQDSQNTIIEGRRTFRFDTFGDEAFWGDTIQLHKAIEGARFGGVGPGLSPAMALALGLKVDAQAIPPSLAAQIRAGQVNLNDPAVTLALLRLQAVVGVTGFFNPDGMTLRSVGIQCAICHSTVDNSFAPGIGNRLDGRANRDLNVGAIIALAPNLQPVADLLSVPPATVDVATVLKVVSAWGPGKFDAELFLDGKGFNPMRISNGVVTATNVSAATLIPPAFGLAGVNLHTWTGWGSVTHWNAFVANLEMHGKGRFFDTRLNNPTQFPVAVKNHFFDLPHISPDDDRVTQEIGGTPFLSVSAACTEAKAGRGLRSGRGHARRRTV